jgi:hypothetical protein
MIMRSSNPILGLLMKLANFNSLQHLWCFECTSKSRCVERGMLYTRDAAVIEETGLPWIALIAPSMLSS